ncbi:MAG: NfeD family protein [Candidatus Kaelpia imicola]|nr:NfeD family protein [Candidatus Kaelpia imicola]
MKNKRKDVLIILIISLLLSISNVSAEKIMVIPVKGVIDLGLSTFIKNSVEKAETQGIATIILEMDTPGGRVDAADIICEALIDYQGETVTFVTNQAWSAGSMIALSSDRIIMRPAASIGSAEPRQGITGEKADEKIVSALRARFKALAEEKDHNTALAQAMVDKDIIVFKILLDDKTLIVTEEELNEKRATERGKIKILTTISEEGKLLNLSAKDAQKYNLAEAICEDREALIAYLGIENLQITEERPSWSENLVRFITHPVLSSLLLGIGFWAIMLALRIPGLGLPEVAGISALGLFFWGHKLAGLSGWLDILLVIIGLTLILIELFIIPGFGLTGAAGALTLLAGIVLTLTNHPIYPPINELNRASGIMLSSLFISLTMLFISLKIFPKTKFWNKLILEYQSKKPETEGELAISDSGIAISDLRPVGRAKFGDKIYDVETLGDYIQKGEKVKIISKHGSIRKVKKA